MSAGSRFNVRSFARWFPSCCGPLRCVLHIHAAPFQFRPQGIQHSDIERDEHLRRPERERFGNR
jgi:hypothetical protein